VATVVGVLAAEGGVGVCEWWSRFIEGVEGRVGSMVVTASGVMVRMVDIVAVLVR